MKNNMIYPGHKAMTFEDAHRMEALNESHDWGFTLEELRYIGEFHETAREKNDIRMMEMIEYRLDDCNFHAESALLNAGKYDEYNAAI